MLAWRRCTSRSATLSLSGVCAKLVAQMKDKQMRVKQKAAKETKIWAGAPAKLTFLNFVFFCLAFPRVGGIFFISDLSSCTSTSLYLICSPGCKQNSYDFFGRRINALIELQVERGVPWHAVAWCEG